MWVRFPPQAPSVQPSCSIHERKAFFARLFSTSSFFLFTSNTSLYSLKSIYGPKNITAHHICSSNDFIAKAFLLKTLNQGPEAYLPCPLYDFGRVVGGVNVKVYTKGYANTQVRQTVRINTNDPKRPLIEVTVMGVVDKFAELQPEEVSLNGSAGTSIFAEVVIFPRKEYPFVIKDLEAAKGDFIEYNLIHYCGKDSAPYTARIENKRTTPRRYYDILYIVTDSQIQPKIPVYVTGAIH